MAWLRMMGAESVAYHRRTVLERGDDYPGMALAYYASRGETPLRWGGTGAAALGLDGPVTVEGYEAVYGSGGAAIRGAGSGWCRLAGRAWNWSYPPTKVSPS